MDFEKLFVLSNVLKVSDLIPKFGLSDFPVALEISFGFVVPDLKLLEKVIVDPLLFFDLNQRMVEEQHLLVQKLIWFLLCLSIDLVSEFHVLKDRRVVSLSLSLLAGHSDLMV